ncbi:DUF4241 domain-containing protein [Streptomyces sp. S6]|nr:DUF4241 domain-containing protein [Streptomyces sp. S6]
MRTDRPSSNPLTSACCGSRPTQLAVSDPGWVEDPGTVAAPQGGFLVVLSLSLLRTAYGVEVAVARVTFQDAPPREWEMVLSPDEDLGLLGEGQFYFYGVGSVWIPAQRLSRMRLGR